VKTFNINQDSSQVALLKVERRILIRPQEMISLKGAGVGIHFH